MANTEYSIMQTHANTRIKLDIIDSGNSTDILSYFSYEVERVRIQCNGSNNEISLLSRHHVN